MMRRMLLAAAVLLSGLLLWTAGASSAQNDRVVLVLTAEGPLTPAMAEYLDRGLARAAEDGAEALVFQLDTPGGAIDLMNRMVRSIRASPVPVIVYVAPRGAIAGSAGTVITLAGHVAAMAPETAIGAASPVGGQGEDLGETIETKQKEILKATVRSLAERRGPEAIALAEATIEEALAASAQEALDVGLIDIVATDLDDLLLQLDGVVVELDLGSRPLRTSGADVVEVPMSFIEEFLQALTNPNIVFLLMAVGVQAVLIELSSPGGWIAGFIGVVCLSLGAYGLGVLPVNWFGFIFLIMAFILFFIEVTTATFGGFAIAGLISFIVGALVLFNSPGTPEFQRVSVPLVIGAAIVTAGFFMVVVSFAIRAQLRPAEVGAEALIGRTGTAATDLGPAGTVHVAGELWSAEVQGRGSPVAAGQRVEVVGVEGLRLSVRPTELPGTSGGEAPDPE